MRLHAALLHPVAFVIGALHQTVRVVHHLEADLESAKEDMHINFMCAIGEQYLC